MNNHLLKIKTITSIGLMTAILCIISPFAFPLPFSPVPITFSTLALCLCVFLLGIYKSIICGLLYLLIGAIGLPVFAGFTGGIGRLFGPTGGYLIGYLLLLLIFGYFSNKGNYRFSFCMLGMALGSLSCYLFGSLWLSISTDISFVQALLIGVVPYLPADIAKMFLAYAIGMPIRKAIIRAGLLAP